MNILEVIKEKMQQMTKSEQKIASYCLGHLSDFAFYPLDTLAESVSTSTASVIRFCRKLGFSGYKDFQDAVRSGFRYQPSLPDKFKRTVASNEITQRIIEKNVSCIYKSFEQIPNERIIESVAALSNAKRVFTFGMKESFALAHYAYTRFLTVRDNVYLLNAGYNGEIEAVLSLQKDDVCVVFLFHRYTRQALAMLPLIKKSGAKVILVTSSPCDEVKEYADILLLCTVDSESIKNTAVAPVCLVDCLCNAVVVENGEASLEYMKKSEDLFRSVSVLGS